MLTKSQRRQAARKYNGDPKTARIFLRTAATGTDAKPGADVTEEARGWKNIRQMLKNGVVEMIPLTDHRLMAPGQPITPPKAAKPEKTEEQPETESDSAEPEEPAADPEEEPDPLPPEIEDLKRLNARTAIGDVRSALTAAGVEFDDEDAKSKPRLLKMAAEKVLLANV